MSDNQIEFQRLKEDEDGFLFQLGDSDRISHFRRGIDDGVDIIGTDQFSFIEFFFFKKPTFTFDSAIAWLKNIGIDPSSVREAMFEKGGKHMVMLESTQSKFQSANQAKGEFVDFLLVEAVAIAPGTHKDFKFSLEVIHDAVGLYSDDVRIVESHRFEEPSDVKGKITASRTDPRGIVVNFYVDSKSTIEKVNDGTFHSVSSNFLLEVDEDMTVTAITKVVELTLTGNPAVEESVITDTATVAVPLEEPKELVEPESTELTVSGDSSPIDTPSPKEDGVTMSEDTNTNKEASLLLEKLEKMAEDTKELRAQLEAANQEKEIAEKNAEKLELEKIKHTAEFQAEQWVKEDKIYPAQSDVVKDLLVKLSGDEEGTNLLHKAIDLNKILLEEGQKSITPEATETRQTGSPSERNEVKLTKAEEELMVLSDNYHRRNKPAMRKHSSIIAKSQVGEN